MIKYVISPAHHSIKHWADKVAGKLDYCIPLSDIHRKLFVVQRRLLSEQGVTLDHCEDPPETIADECADEDDEPTLSVQQAALKFAMEKREGPDTICGCCQQLWFCSTMTRYTQKTHDKVQDFSTKQTLAYLLARPWSGNGRLCCSNCIGILRKGKTPPFCFGEHSPLNANDGKVTLDTS